MCAAAERAEQAQVRRDMEGLNQGGDERLAHDDWRGGRGGARGADRYGPARGAGGQRGASRDRGMDNMKPGEQFTVALGVLWLLKKGGLGVWQHALRPQLRACAGGNASSGEPVRSGQLSSCGHGKPAWKA